MKLPAIALCAAGVLAAAPVRPADPLAGAFTIYRDRHGVPHIVGDTEEAAFFGYGWAQAEDHLEKMMVQYLDAQGRRAEVQGKEALGDGYLRFIPYEYRWDGDYLQRLLRTKRGVVERRAEIEPATWRVLDAFARGVNAWVEAHRPAVPAWVEPIAAEDVEALERSQYFRFYSIHDALGKMSDLPASFPALGSNQWAIAKAKSASGRVIHVEHTHMPWANRFQNYEAHLIVPGRLDAGGISWFGSPFFLDGFNDRITWSATWNEPNMADVYEEEIDPGNPLRYRYEGGWRDIRVERETFRAKGPAGMEEVALPLHYTHHGPIVSFDRAKGRAWSVKLPNFEGVNYGTALYGLLKCRTLGEFKAHVARQLMPRWNLLFTDAENIYWVHNANVARRADGFDWRRPVPGWTARTEWGPYIPFDLYPQVLDPPSGFLQNCNNPPWVCTRNSGLRPLDPAPYYLRNAPSATAGEEALNTRGERLFAVLGQDRKFTREDMEDLGFDTYILAADAIVPLLLRAAAEDRERGARPEVARAIERLRSWDRRSSKDSVAYTIIHFWGRAYRERFGGLFGRFNAPSRRSIDLGSREEQRRALDALESALGTIGAKYGKPEVPWGEINVVVRGGTFPLGGTDTMYDPLHIDEGIEGEDGRIRCRDGWGHLLIVVEGEPKEVWSLLPYGESEDPRSPHYDDQARLHSERRAKRFPVTPAEILAGAESVWGRPDRLKGGGR